MVRIAYSANRFSDTFKARLRDLITIFSAEPGRMIRFDLETYSYDFFPYPFTPESGMCSWFIDCSLPADELAEEVSLFRAEAKEAFARLKEIAPKSSTSEHLKKDPARQNHYSK